MSVINRTAGNGMVITVEILDCCPVAFLDGKKESSGLFEIKPPVSKDGKLLTHRIGRIAFTAAEFGTILEAQEAARVETAATLEANVPGLSEMTHLLDVSNAEADRYQYQFEQMMDDEGNDGARPPKPINNAYREQLTAMMADHPRAALYLKARAQSSSTHWADNTGAGAAGRKAMDILATGGSIEDAITAMAVRRDFVD